MRAIAVVVLFLSLGVFAYWGLTGAHVATQYQVATEVTEEDEFGDSVTKTVMKDEFQFGLTPTDKIVDAALPLGLGLAVLGSVLFLIDLKTRKRRT